MANGHQVLIVEDEPDMARCLADLLASDFDITMKSTSADALSACQEREFGVVVSDVHLDGMDGIELMSRIRRVQPRLPVILLTGRGSVNAAVDAIKRGAFDYVTKPCDGVELRNLVERAYASRESGSKALLRAPASGRRPRHYYDDFVGKSVPMQALQARIDLVASSSSSVLIVGETGTGKELVARSIHARSGRRRQPFIAVNASAIPEALLESEMFGHTRGAFTGATQSHRGYFTQADGGTLLLDEIGDMPLGLQAKLLRVLQAGEIHPVGSGSVEHVDVRVIAATHRHLPALVKTGQFREDLFYRLNVIAIALPPLRKRRGDIAELASVFLNRARERAPAAVATSVRSDLMDALASRDWPGNVRELESAIERLVVLAQESELTPEHLSLIEDEEPDIASVAASADVATIDDIVQSHVLAVLARTAGDKPRAAKLLGIDLSTLYRWQKKWPG